MWFLVAAPAAAQGKSDRELAQEHFNAGARAYVAKDYSEAVVQFLTALEYEDNAMILYNLSLAYQGLGDVEKSRTVAGRVADREDLPDKARPRNDARIVALGVIIEAVEGAVRAERMASASDQAGTSSADPVITTGSAVPRGGGLGALGWIGTAAMGIGAGMLAYTALFHLAVASDIEQFEESPTVRRRDNIASDQRKGRILLYTGSGLVVAGLTLFLIDVLADSDETVAASIAPTPGGASVQIGGTF